MAKVMVNTHTVIGLVGSYRKDGVIDSVITEILSAAEQAGATCKKIYLQDQHIEFCHNCRTCMQQAGTERGKCVIHDDMEKILSEIESADRLVIGAPVNIGNVNALTRKFMERCAGYAYWPWGSPAPKVRNKTLSKKAVIVSSSAAPALMARYLMGAMGALKTLAKMLHAKTIGVVWVGLVNQEHTVLTAKQKHKAHIMGKKLVSI